MSEVTLRDRIWNAVLEYQHEPRSSLKAHNQTIRTEAILDRLDLDDGQRRTVRRTLNAMVELGYLRHEPRKRDWRYTPKALNPGRDE